MKNVYKEVLLIIIIVSENHINADLSEVRVFLKNYI